MHPSLQGSHHLFMHCIIISVQGMTIHSLTRLAINHFTTSAHDTMDHALVVMHHYF